jgi:hypothetical protein
VRDRLRRAFGDRDLAAGLPDQIGMSITDSGSGSGALRGL